MPATFLTVALLAAASGCTTTGMATPDLVGAWSTSVSGYPVTVTYTDVDVSVEGATPQPYTLVDGVLTIGDERRTVRFESAKVLVLVDPVTGTEQRYTRR